MKKSILISSIFFLAIIIANAQPGPGMMRYQNRDKIEAEKVAYITQQLNLTPSEAQIFWPVYNEYKSKKDLIIKDRMGKFCPYGKQVPNIETITDKEATEMADQFIINHQKMLDLQKEYHVKFKAVLPPKKLLLLYQTEKDFNKVLLKKMRGNRFRK